MDQTIVECAKWLKENENPDKVVEVLRSLHPRSLNKNVGKVRLEWMQIYGARHNAGPVRSTLRSGLTLIKKEAAKAKKTKGQRKYLKQLKSTEERVLMFAKFDLPAKWSARRRVHSRKDSFTGLTEIDEHLRRVQLLPAYVFSARAYAGRKTSSKEKT